MQSCSVHYINIITAPQKYQVIAAPPHPKISQRTLYDYYTMCIVSVHDARDDDGDR